MTRNKSSACASANGERKMLIWGRLSNVIHAFLARHLKIFFVCFLLTLEYHCKLTQDNILTNFFNLDFLEKFAYMYSFFLPTLNHAELGQATFYFNTCIPRRLVSEENNWTEVELI